MIPLFQSCSNDQSTPFHDPLDVSPLSQGRRLSQESEQTVSVDALNQLSMTLINPLNEPIQQTPQPFQYKLFDRDKAEEFGKMVESLKNSRDPDQVSSFMTELGQSKGFDFRQSVAALAALAGAEETLAHNLSIEGGPYTIRNDSEDGLVNPRDMVTADLNRMARA